MSTFIINTDTCNNNIDNNEENEKEPFHLLSLPIDVMIIILIKF